MSVEGRGRRSSSTSSSAAAALAATLSAMGTSLHEQGQKQTPQQRSDMMRNNEVPLQTSSVDMSQSAALAGLITQTDAAGNPMRRGSQASGGENGISLLRESRMREQNELERSKRQLRISDGHRGDDGGFLCRLCSICLNFCCCIPNDEDASGYGGRGLPGTTLLPPQLPEMKGRKCLILDLDETLVHSSFKPVPNPDIIIPVNIDGVTHRVYVIKRPGVDVFLEKLGSIYEIVVFTASLSKYADPLLDILDINHVIQGRLFRESCTCHNGNYVKDLTLLGREVKEVIIVDNSPASYLFQPENAIGVSTFIDDMEDRELYYCLPFLEAVVDVPDVTKTLHTYPSFIQRQAELARQQLLT